MAPVPAAPSAGNGPPETRPRLTLGTLFVLGSMNLIDCINLCLLNPYVDRMVSGFLDLSPADPRVVQTVGLLVGLYSLCEVLFSPFWGYLADRLGRRPVLLIGLAGTAVAPILFGLAQSLPMVFVARAIDGFFCGNIGVTKTYLGEIVDSTNEARGFSCLAMCFAMGLLVGPMLGGELVFPATWAPGLFAGTIFERFPYLLPNLTYACLAVVAWILGAVSLQETLPRAQRRPLWRSATVAAAAPRPATERESRRGPLLQAEPAGLAPGTPAEPQPGAALGRAAAPASAVERRRCCGGSGRSLQMPWSAWPRRLTQSVLAWCVGSGYYAAWTQNFILIVTLPRSNDGFDLGPREIGMLQNCAAVGLLTTQLFLYPLVAKRLGYLYTIWVGWLLNIAVTLPFPAYGLLAGAGPWKYVPLGFVMFFGQIGAGFIFPTVMVCLNRRLDGMDKATVNGWANSIGAMCRAVFPNIVGVLLSIGLRSGVGCGRYLGTMGNIAAGIGSLALSAAALERDEGKAARKPQLVSAGAAAELQDAGVGA